MQQTQGGAAELAPFALDGAAGWAPFAIDGLIKLISMGFDEVEATLALEVTLGNVDAAIAMLVELD